MALANPLPRAAFADLLSVADVTLVQGWQQQRSATGGEETRYADRAPALWKADVTTGIVENAESEGLMALINSRAGGLKSLLLHNYKLPYPRTDPNGLIFGAAAPVVGVITDRLHVAFTGFPAAYELPLGTYFGIVFDTSRYYLGQFVEAKTASGTGAVTSVEIWPPLPATVLAGNPVTVAKPVAKFRIVPGSAYPAISGTLHSTIKFAAEQTYSAT